MRLRKQPYLFCYADDWSAHPPSRVGSMELLVLPDLFAPFAALFLCARLVRKQKFPVWLAFAVAAFSYLAWANLVARTAGYSLSIYALMGTSFAVGRVLGPPGIGDRELLLFWYPLAGLVVVPTLLLWTMGVIAHNSHEGAGGGVRPAR